MQPGSDEQGSHEQWVVLGRIATAHGIKGWVKLQSFTDPAENLLNYKHWRIQRGQHCLNVELKQGRPQGKALVAQLVGINDRTQAESLRGYDISVLSDALPALDEGDYYWHQLQGLKVQTLNGDLLGEIDHILPTGANDVLVVKPIEGSVDDRERLVPLVFDHVVTSVDLEAALVRVDWQTDY